MIGTERYSYLSRLKTIDPTAKLTITMVSMLICLFADSMVVGWFTVLVFCVLSCIKGGTAPQIFLRGLRAPFIFALIGVATAAIGRFPLGQPMLLAVTIKDYQYGFSPDALRLCTMILSRAMGCVASVYFTVLSTPITDLLLAFRRLHVPQLMISLMELIYRFIFVLYDTANRIHIAQESRLGYQGLKRSYHSLGTLLAMVFLKAYRKSDRVYTALEARGYTGELCTLSQVYQSGKLLYIWCGMISILQLIVLALERSFL